MTTQTTGKDLKEILDSAREQFYAMVNAWDDFTYNVRVNRLIMGIADFTHWTDEEILAFFADNPELYQCKFSTPAKHGTMTLIEAMRKLLADAIWDELEREWDYVYQIHGPVDQFQPSYSCVVTIQDGICWLSDEDGYAERPVIGYLTD